MMNNSGYVIVKLHRYLGFRTNNEAEYEGRWQAEHIPQHDNSEPYRLAKKAIVVHEEREAAVV